MSIIKRDTSRNQTEWIVGGWTFYANIPENFNESKVINVAKGIVDFALPQKFGPYGTHYYSFVTREYVLNLILYFYQRHQRFPHGDICVVDHWWWETPSFLNSLGFNTFFKSRKRKRNYSPGYWVYLPSLDELKVELLKNQAKIDLWTSNKFLDEYFTKLKFSEKYSKATGSNAGQWVRNPWERKMKDVIYDFVKDYVKKYNKLPEGEHTFNVDWNAPNARWLKKVLQKKQIVFFPKIE
jgi:hypothetical protein